MAKRENILIFVHLNGLEFMFWLISLIYMLLNHLTAPPSSLHALPLLISNCLNLPFVTQGSSGWLNKAYLLKAIKEEIQKDFLPRNPTGS